MYRPHPDSRLRAHLRRVARLVRRRNPPGDPTKGVPAEALNDLLRSQSVRGSSVQLLNTRFLHFAKHVPGRDGEYWQLLRAYAAKLKDSVDAASFVSKVSAQAKVLLTLTELDRRADAESFVASFGLNLDRFPTRVTPAGVISELPGYGTLPESLFLLTDAQLTVKAAITSSRSDGEQLILEGYAYIHHLDLANNSTQVQVNLVDASGRTHELDTQPWVDQRIDEVSKHYFADYRPAGFRATAPTSVRASAQNVVVTVVTAGFTRTHDLGPLEPPPTPAEGPSISKISHDANLVEMEFAGVTPHEVFLRSPRKTLTAVVGTTARFDLSIDGLAPPSGRYELIVVNSAGQRIMVRTDVDLDLLLPLARVRTVTRAETAALRISAPLKPDERGHRNQQRLRDAARVSRAERNAVFFRALYGEVANCNGRAVHRELVSRGSKLELFWSVRDRSVAIPDGGTAIVEGTQEWHSVLATARFHMVNVHQLDWFNKPEGQVMIQTMHGYPYKTMGHDWWAKGDFSAAQVARFDRRATEWDYFVSPATYATPLLDAAFLSPAGAHPEILEIGYPRNDDLVIGDPAVRDRVRSALGIQPHQTAVMYAPTFRDYLAINDMKARAVDFFDPFAASRALGPDYVILMRGHAFNARTDERGESSSTVIDVTDHPEINELCLASDVAILDYSSLRFDYALTDKPMIFLVPDIEEWHRARGGVVDYAPTAPGPRVDSTQEVIRELSDINALAHSWSEARATFRAAYTDLDDGHASARLVDAVFRERGDV